MKGVRIVLLCEDSQTDSFVRRFLKKRKWRHRDIETAPLPHGSQSAEQWVRERYPLELKAVRVKRGTRLLVVIDVDSLSTEQRRAQLDEQCRKAGVPPRAPEDPAIVIVPRRNIETWFAYLDGAVVDEQRQYPKLNRTGDCERHARSLHKMCHDRQALRDPAPGSLREACIEYGGLAS
ncbi:MAG: hypothetical protein OXE80_11505 [Gammaproteobacteria bacterium]|nr:hypothetical protein [Gammaproteobacteria bacterium]